MDKTQILAAMEEIIKTRPASTTRTYHICYWEDKLQCLPFNHTGENHHIFRKLTEWQIHNGLKPNEWTRLHFQIITFYRELEKCQKPSTS